VEIRMKETISQQIVLASRPQGAVQLSDFRLEEIPRPTPGPREMLLEVKYLSLDPYMRGRMSDRKSYAEPAALGSVMPGESIASVLESNHVDFAVGETVLAFTGWRTHALSNGGSVRKVDHISAPVTTRLGVLGMPGFTAYSGLKVIGKPSSGETLVVAAAAGPVGSLVGQLARMAGARAVGIAGGPRKCELLKEEFGFDDAVDHRADDFPKLLASACPHGIDVYFENVGGAVWEAVLPLLNQFARVPVCGLIAQYTSEPKAGLDQLPGVMRTILTKSLTLRGFINNEFETAYYEDFLRDVSQGIAAGRVRYREDITDGLENAPRAFIDMLAGRNVGKVLVRVAM
jgi:NADPH-dependent curcumin reductase CurA